MTLSLRAQRMAEIARLAREAAARDRPVDGYEQARLYEAIKDVDLGGVGECYLVPGRGIVPRAMMEATGTYAELVHDLGKGWVRR